jgi:predicted anti-sigma-YlaC factor YlaD
MERSIHSIAEGRVGLWAKLYALAHIARCGRCRSFLQFLEEYIREAKAAKNAPSVPEDALRRLEQGAWRKVRD